MPISSNAFVRSNLLLLLVGLLALLGIVATALWLVERTQVYFNEVIEARDARTATVDLRNVLQELESSQRGFLVTLDERYLEPYEAGLPAVWTLYDQLAAVLVPYPQATQPMADLRQGIEVKLDEMSRTIELARAGQLEEAVALVQTDRGQAEMEQARILFTALINAADQRLSEGATNQRDTANWLRIFTVAGAVVIILVVGGSAWTVLTYTRELAQAREELQVLNTDLEGRVRERVADLGRANEEIQRFAYIVTHDLRAPLVNIMGFTSELEASTEPLKRLVDRLPPDTDPEIVEEARRTADEDLPEAINFIRSSTRKMDGLINAILKLSREGRRQLRPERIELTPLLENAANAIGHQVSEAGGEVGVDMQVPAIVSDRLSLEQVFGNLLDNAVKYSSPDRPLRIDVTGRMEAGNRVVIEVADNGRGIAEMDHERVFELFRRSGTQDQTGEGIGLAHVRTLVRNLGGDITLQSRLGEGTIFRVSLPRDLRATIGSIGA